MDIDIVGEDEVTQTIIERLIGEYRTDLTIGTRHPLRAGGLVKLAPKYNDLGKAVFLLTDLDAHDCAPQLISKWFGDSPISDDMIFRVACDEAESWLMADREGFAKWVGVSRRLIPETTLRDVHKNIFELPFPYKPSLYMMRELAAHSRKTPIRDGLTPRLGAKKGPAYNATLTPFISDIWDVENAVQNSYSLSKAVQRLNEFKLE